MTKIKNIFQTIKNKVKNIRSMKDIQRKLIFTILMVVLYRLMAGVPLPGVDPEAFKQIVGDTPFNNIFTLISGGRLDQPSLAALGVAPYINASIIIQLLTTVIPKLEELNKQGEQGRNTINQYTRLLTIPLALVQSIMIYYILTNPQFGGQEQVEALLSELNGIKLAAFILSLTAGSIFLMWIGELISQYGIGNGASILIAIGIIANIPSLVLGQIEGLSADWASFLNGNINALTSNNFQLLLLVVVFIVLMVIFIVIMSEAVRKIPVKYARRYRSNTDAKNHLPIRLNQAGVMPVIFAQALLTFPQIISQFILSVDASESLENFANSITNSSLLKTDTAEHWIVLSLLIIAFTFFYTFVVVKPEEVAKNLQKSGAFIPGIRPGNSTIKYINRMTMKLTFFGALFLAIIAILPNLVRLLQNSDQLTIFSVIGGTSLLIVVGVFMDAYRKTKSLQSVQNYEIFK